MASRNVLAVNMFLRMFIVWLKTKRGPRLGPHDVGRLSMRVLPNDLDTLGHVNNGRYLSLMDLGRLDLMMRAGVWKRLTVEGMYPVVVNETISFRKSLNPWQKYTIESRITGYDAKAVYMVQRFVVDGEIFAEAVVRARFLRRSGGTVTIEELADVLGVDISGMAPPEWVAEWAESIALPPTRQAAPSVW